MILIYLESSNVNSENEILIKSAYSKKTVIKALSANKNANQAWENKWMSESKLAKNTM